MEPRAAPASSSCKHPADLYKIRVDTEPPRGYPSAMSPLLPVLDPATSSGAAWAWVAGALLLIAAEFVLPGMVIGTLGALAGIYGLYLAAEAGPSAFALHAAVLVAGVVIELLLFRKLAPSVASRLGLASHAVSDGAAVPGAAAFVELIGREGVALTALAPGGTAEVAGRRVQASSIDGFLDKGTPVVVVEAAMGGVSVRRRR